MQRKFKRQWERKDKTSLKMLKLAGVVTALCLATSLHVVYANPTGGQVATGSGTISQNGSVMNVQQNTPKMSVNWNSFNIAKNETVNFQQPSTSSIALNRVIGNDASSIYGNLNANGQVFLINPNGVLFAQGAKVNVGGLAVSTLNLSDADFNAGKYSFVGKGGTILNQGEINATSGSVALLGGQVTNEGIIAAKQGTVALAAGKAVTLDFAGDNLLNVAIDQGVEDALVANKNLIQADGGYVVMKASTADALAKTVINNSGVIKAQSISNKGGTILLDGGNVGIVENSGKIDATGLNAGESGGNIKVLGSTVTLASTSDINASGAVNGGKIETSGSTVNVGGSVVASGKTGSNGEWLMDPSNLDITDATTYNNSLNNDTDVTLMTVSETKGNPASTYYYDIYVNDAIQKTAGTGTATLKFISARDVFVNKNISSTSGKLNVIFDPDNHSGSETSTVRTNTNGATVVASGVDITTNGGNLKFGTDDTYKIGTALLGSHNISTSGGNVDFYGSLVIGGEESSSTINTGTNGGYLYFHGPVDSANSYKYTKGTYTWEQAQALAYNGTGTETKEKDSLIGASYLVTITSTLENSMVRGLLPAEAATQWATYRFWIGAKADPAVAENRTRTWYWVTGPETGTAFFKETGAGQGYNLNGLYSNWTSGEPNNYSKSNECYATAGYTTASLWNDYPNTTPAGFVTETNRPDANLVIDTGTGPVTFADKVGATKPLSSLTITNAGNVEFDAATIIDNAVKINSSGTISEGTGNTGSITATSLSIVNTGGATNLTGTNNITKVAAQTNNHDFTLYNDSPTLNVTSLTDAAGNTINGVDSGTGKVYIKNTKDITIDNGDPVSSTSTSKGAVVLQSTEGTITNNAGANGISAPNGSWYTWVTAPTNVVLNDETTYDFSQFGVTDLSQVTGSGNGKLYTEPLSIKVTCNGLVSKVYDGTTTSSKLAQLSLVTPNNLVPSDTSVGALSATLTTGDTYNAAFSNKNVGTNKEVDIYDWITLTDVKDANSKPVLGTTTYGITYNGTITPASLVVTAATNTKNYDGTTTAAATPATATLNGTTITLTNGGATLYGSESISGLTEAYTDKNAGTSKTLKVNSTGYTLTEDVANNYNITFVDDTTGVINKAALVINAATNTKVYDTTTSATAKPTTGTLNGTAITLTDGAATLFGTENISGLTESYTNKNAGTGKTLSINATGYTLTEDADNYTISFTPDTTGVITQAPLTIAATPNTKVYDGTTSAAATPTYTGILTGDTVTGLTETYTNKNVLGTNGSTLNVTGYTVNDGNNGANYTVTTATATGTITPATLTITAAPNTKVYDGTTSATATPTASGLFGTDTVTGLTETYNSKNVLGTDGSTLTVSTGYVVNDDNNGANYNVTTATATGTITPATIIIYANAGSKAYDTNTTSSATPVSGTLNGSNLTLTNGAADLYGNEKISNLTESYASKNALGADASTLSVNSNYTLTQDATAPLSNYTVTTQDAKGTITPIALTLTATPNTKVYDGTTSAAATPTYTGILTGDTVTGLTETYTNKNVLGTNGSTLNVTGYTVNDGNNGANYTVTTATATGTITPATLTITAAPNTKVYDGTTSATATPTASGLFGTDTVTGLTETYNSKNVLGTDGSTLTVSTGYVVNDDNNGANYNVSTATGSGTITPATLTITATTDTKTYDGTTSATATPTTTGLIGTDTVTGLTETYASKNVLGTNGSTLNVNGYTISDDNNGANYTVVSKTATGTINPKAVTPSTVGQYNKKYDGNTSATLGDQYNMDGVLAGDTLSLTGVGNYDTAAVGTNKPVTFMDLLLGGADAANYVLVESVMYGVGDITNNDTNVDNYTKPVQPSTPPVDPTDPHVTNQDQSSITLTDANGSSQYALTNSGTSMSAGNTASSKHESSTSLTVYRVSKTASEYVGDYIATGDKDGVILTAAGGNTSQRKLGKSTRTYATALTVNGITGKFKAETDGTVINMLPLNANAQNIVEQTKVDENREVVIASLLTAMRNMKVALDKVTNVYIYEK